MVKNQTKKKLSIAICFILLLVMASNSFANTQESTINFNVPVSKNREHDVALIKAKGISDDLIAKLGDDTDVVAGLIKSKNINEDQVKNLVEGLTNNKYDKATKYVVKDGVVNKEGELVAVPDLKRKYFQYHAKSNNNVTASYSMSTGAHWVAFSKSGYAKGTGFVTLPDAWLNRAPGKTNTVYEIGGIYRADGRGGADMGAYSTDGLTYYLFINQSNLDWAACPEDSTTCGWFSGSTPISKFEHPTLYFIWKATDSNTVEVQCYDGITFQWLASMSFYKDDMGYNSDGIGLQTEREHSLAFIEDTGDLSDGSYMHNSHWYNVYIYNNNVTDQWYSWYTDGTPGPSGTSDEQACVEVISFTRDYEEVVNIDFDLP